MNHPHGESLLVLLLIIVNISICNGQSRTIQGKISDSSTGKPVEYAYILNYTLQKQMYCNSRGEFQLAAHIGDTLVIYALGYDYRKVIIDENMLKAQPADFRIVQQSYALQEARILGLGTYEDFKRSLISLSRPETPTEVLNDYIADISRTAAQEAYDNAMASRYMKNEVTFFSASIYTPEEMERLRLAEIIKEEKMHDQVYQKFNPKMVKEITGLTDDDEIIEFMLFCKFSDEYILEVSVYDLSSRISLKYELFRKHKEDQRIMKNPVNHIDEPLQNFA